MDLRNITIVIPKEKSRNPKGVRLKLTFQQMLEMVKGVQLKKASREGDQNKAFTELDSSKTVSCPQCKTEVDIEIVQGKFLGFGWTRCKGCRRTFHVDECVGKPE